MDELTSNWQMCLAELDVQVASVAGFIPVYVDLDDVSRITRDQIKYAVLLQDAGLIESGWYYLNPARSYVKPADTHRPLFAYPYSSLSKQDGRMSFPPWKPSSNDLQAGNLRRRYGIALYSDKGVWTATARGYSASDTSAAVAICMIVIAAFSI